MTIDDPYLPDEAILQNKSYKGFKLEKVDEINLDEIEKSLESNKINSSNKMDMSEYLDILFKKISEIKRLEQSYEGDDNKIINEYLVRISLLKNQIENIR